VDLRNCCAPHEERLAKLIADRMQASRWYQSLQHLTLTDFSTVAWTMTLRAPLPHLRTLHLVLLPQFDVSRPTEAQLSGLLQIDPGLVAKLEEIRITWKQYGERRLSVEQGRELRRAIQEKFHAPARVAAEIHFRLLWSSRSEYTTQMEAEQSAWQSMEDGDGGDGDAAGV
jgi:hypothetical protein